MPRLFPDNVRGRLHDLFSPVDWYFLGLRLLIAAGGLMWLRFFPLGDVQREAATWTFTGYLLFSVLLYASILRWPERIRSFYLMAVLVDTGLVYALVRSVGQNRGSFFIMFYLLIAISSFYFGWATGLGIAFLASALYTHIYLIDTKPGLYPLGDFILRTSFFLLIAVSMAFLAEREKRDKARIRELNEELTRKNAILEQAYRYLSLGRLSAGIAERVNNPTSILVGRIELLLMEARRHNLPEAAIKDLEVVAKHAQRIGAVAKSLLAFSQRQPYEPRPVHLNDVIEDALLLMEAEFEGRQIIVKKQLSSALPLINGDRHGLNEVMVNLLSNAVDALPKGGTIQITTRANGGGRGAVECVVADDGSGIPPEHLERIFEPFFSTKSDRGGIGLGLSTSLRIMKQHGGLIQVSSDPRNGSRFTMTFPVVGS
jgi:signal transduction histidine kinase